LRQLQNFEKEDAWKHGRLIARQYRELQSYLPKDKIEILKLAQLSDIKTFIAKQLWKTHHIEALAYGDLYSSTAIQLTKDLMKTLAMVPLAKEKTYQQAYLDAKAPLQQRHTQQLQTNNACYRMDLLLGPDSLKNRMLAQVISNFISEPFYSEMRTRQQLGYIVWSGAFADKLNHYLTFIIQSGTHQATQVEEKAITFLPKLIELAQKIGDEEFEVLKKAIREKLLEKNNAISSKASELFNLTFDEHRNYELKDELLNALDGLAKSDIASALQTAFDPKKEVSLTLILEADDPNKPSDTTSDVAGFKKAQAYRSPAR
jgi:insulysin